MYIYVMIISVKDNLLIVYLPRKGIKVNLRPNLMKITLTKALIFAYSPYHLENYYERQVKI